MSVVAIYDYFKEGITAEKFAEICKDAGVSEIHVSIITGRCGSTLLSYLTDKLGFGRGQEPFNEWPEETLKNWAAPDEFHKFLTGIIEASVVNGRFYFQTDPLRLAAIQKLLPEGTRIFPGVTKYTVMMRRNIVAQAISYVNAHSSGLWHSNQRVGDAQAKTGFSVQKTMYWIEHIHRMEKIITEMFPEPPDTYYYEDLASAPFETVTHFLQRSGFDVRPILTANTIADGDKPQKIVRDAYAGQYMTVINQYPWLRDVLKERTLGVIPSPTLEARIVPTEELGSKLME